ncbi:hypothetical protein MTO96_024463 [Rhipicephalus appendiculatus]
MIYRSVIFAAVLALSYSADKPADGQGAPVPCVDKSCNDFCVKLVGGPEFNVTGSCAKYSNGTKYCNCNRRTYCTEDVCSRSCDAYHNGKPKLRAECEKYLCRCIWEDQCDDVDCSMYCQRKYYHQRPLTGRCDGLDCVCSWSIGYSMHKHPLPPYS